MRSVWPWVVIAPLGWPVVPEVNTRSERSPEVIDAVRPAATSAEHRPPSRRKTSQSTTGSPVAVDRGGGESSVRSITTRSRSGSLSPARDRLVEHRRVVGAEEPSDGEEDPGPRLPQDVGRLVSLEPGVEGHQQRAGTDGAQGGDHPLGAVGRPDRHPVAPLDPVGHDGAGGGGHLVGQLVEGQPDGRPAGTVAVDHGLGLAEAGGGVLHQAGDGPPLQIPAGSSVTSDTPSG